MKFARSRLERELDILRPRSLFLFFDEAVRANGDGAQWSVASDEKRWMVGDSLFSVSEQLRGVLECLKIISDCSRIVLNCFELFPDRFGPISHHFSLLSGVVVIVTTTTFRWFRCYTAQSHECRYEPTFPR